MPLPRRQSLTFQVSAPSSTHRHAGRFLAVVVVSAVFLLRRRPAPRATGPASPRLDAQQYA
eukprot:14578092-Alexandrium_andersonii.AAC.1